MTSGYFPLFRVASNPLSVFSKSVSKPVSKPVSKSDNNPEYPVFFPRKLSIVPRHNETEKNYFFILCSGFGLAATQHDVGKIRFFWNRKLF